MKTIMIDGVEYAPVQKHEDKPLVITRARDSGVHVGRLLRREGREVELADARRIWHWKGANTLNEVAVDGVAKGSKVSQPVSSIILLDVCEVIPCAVAIDSGWPL